MTPIKGILRLLTGERGEDRAEALLRKNGYRIIERNYRCARGEIDIVARDGETIAFVEVKTRSSEDFGGPKYSVDKRKQRKLTEVAVHYIAERGIRDTDLRFDVVSIVVKDGAYKTELIKDAFEAVEV
ncbi:MAG: YraN family protein [Deltaproteobacteria bacterium]|nr:YraN family protein [Deltaproteobacteria bacterium]